MCGLRLYVRVGPSFERRGTIRVARSGHGERGTTGRREERVRIGAAMLIVAVLALLFLRDWSPVQAPQVDSPSPTVTPTYG